MNSKNEKRLCWNCDGYVSHTLTHCPYCSVHLEGTKTASFSEIKSSLEPPYQAPELALSKEEDLAKKASPEEPHFALGAILLLFPGVGFLLFGLLLMLFSKDGVLTLQWREHFGYFYLLGAIPLIVLGWRTIKKNP